MLLKVKVIIVGLLMLAVGSIVFLGYVHYTTILNERDILKANNAILEIALQEQNDTIATQSEAIDEWKETLTIFTIKVREMEKSQRDAQSETRRLNDIFGGHDFDRLLLEKPSLIENRINDGHGRANRLLECASGAANTDCASGSTTAP